MAKIIIIGGGWAGCAAALAAKKAGGSVTILERTDMLLGTGLVGGIMRNNGRFTAAEEMIAMGGGELFLLCDSISRHRDIEFPGHRHASLYDISRVHGAVLQLMMEYGIEVNFLKRISKIEMSGRTIIQAEDSKGFTINGDVFIDATGTAGPMQNCIRHGKGCAMCMIRCPSFGGRISFTGLTGVKEYVGKKTDGSEGAMSGSCKLLKESLSKELSDQLNADGVAIVPVPKEYIKDHLDQKACQQYALDAFKENLILLDTGHAKLMTPYYDLHVLRKIPGLENARYEDPYAGGIGNSMRFFDMAPRDNCLKINQVDNLFCCGEKAGLLVGHTEAIVTGTLAGYNSVRLAQGRELCIIPEDLAVGDAIAYVNARMKTEEGLTKKYTFSGSVYFERMKELSLYTTVKEEIKSRVKRADMGGIFS